jgi:hypothetical protein
VARRAKVGAVTSTQFFSDVTPLWVGPGKLPIEKCYHEAVQDLAIWAGPNWSNNEQTFFFPIRHGVIKACERWNTHDWKSDVAGIAERREDAKRLGELERSFARFARTLGKAPFRQQKRMLGLIFLAELCPDEAIGLPLTARLSDVDKAVERFHEELKIRRNYGAQYGPVEYAGLPKQLPQREIAIALSLAVFITVWRRDGLAMGNHLAWQQPVLSKDLPWKSIANFAWANSANPTSSCDSKDVQKRVTSLAKKAALVFL